MSRARWQNVKNNQRRKFFRRLFVLVLLFSLLFWWVDSRLSPQIAVYAEQAAHNAALVTMTEAVIRQNSIYRDACDYQQLMYIERDESGHITLLAADTMLLNELIASIVLDIEESLNTLSRQKLSVPLGALTGSSLLADFGPDLKIGFRAQSIPRVTIEDEFSSAGINQVRHRLYVHVECELRVMAPFASETTQAAVTVLLAEGVIVGYTPDTYVGIGGD